jgi:SAM-dependent methyltransferase
MGPLLLPGCLEERPDSGRPIRMLDLACGAGHSSFVMRLLHPDLSVVSVDHDFVSLYLSKRFMGRNATHLCLDAEVPSPFPDEYFDGVFCLDAFHYLHSKRAVIAELKRVVGLEGMWLFPHLHNALRENITAGVPLSPEAYLECFDIPGARLFDEATILRALSQEHTLDLREQAQVSKLNQSPTVTLIAGKPDLWRKHGQFPSSLCRKRSSLVLNPIYRRAHGKAEWTLTWPNDEMRTECGGAEKVLPATGSWSKTELQHLLSENSKSDEARLSELVARFVLVPLPTNYCRDAALSN